MTSKLVMDRLAAAGLTAILSLRERGELLDAAARAVLAASDTLLLGAAADLARRRELGDEATIFVPGPPAGGVATIIRPLAGVGEGGTAILRRIAITRLSGEAGAGIVVDWTEIGLHTAQLGLSFGASGLAGPIAARRGLPLADAEGQRAVVKRREIAAFVERAGYRPRFVNTSPASEAERLPSVPSPRGNAHVGS